MLKMDKRGSGIYDIGVSVILSPLKFLTVGMFLVIFLVIISAADDSDVNIDSIEGNEIVNTIFHCILSDNKINEDLITESNLKSCLNVDKYGVRVSYDDREVVTNDEIFFTYEGLCNRIAQCNSFLFKDADDREVLVEIVFRKNE